MSGTTQPDGANGPDAPTEVNLLRDSDQALVVGVAVSVAAILIWVFGRTLGGEGVTNPPLLVVLGAIILMCGPTVVAFQWRTVADAFLRLTGRPPAKVLADAPKLRVAAVFWVSLSSLAVISWLTFYSGGPVVGPFGQLLFSLPVMSAFVANKKRTVVLIYVVTVAFAAIVEAAVKIVGNDINRPEADRPLFYVATAIALLLSLGSAFFVREREGAETAPAAPA